MLDLTACCWFHSAPVVHGVAITPMLIVTAGAISGVITIVVLVFGALISDRR